MTRAGLALLIPIPLRGPCPRPPIPLSRDETFSFVRFREQTLSATKQKRPALRAGPCDPGGIQTHDRLLRRQELCSAELPGHSSPPGRAVRRKTAAKIIKNRQEAKPSPSRDQTALPVPPPRSGTPHSLRNASTGFANAALTARRLIVASVISIVSAAASAKIHQLMLTR